MSAEKVQQALIKQFRDTFPNWLATQVAWENVAFTPDAGKPWMFFHFMPVDERIETLGPTGLDQLDGLVQIDVKYPVGAGEAGSRETINELRTCFKPGIIGYDGQSVTILSRNRSGGRTSDGFYLIPFTVRWKAHLNR